MKKRFSFLLACLMLSYSAGAVGFEQFKVRTDLQTGKQPLYAYSTGATTGLTHVVFCGGSDFDYDGLKDEGEESPSFWGIVRGTPGLPELSTVKLLEADFQLTILPFRPAFSNGSLYYCSAGIVRRFTVENPQSYDDFIVRNDSVTAINASSIDVFGGKLYLAVRPGWTDPGFVARYDLTTNEYVDTMAAEVNPQQTVFYDGKSFTLNEGIFGATNSSISVYKINGDMPEFLTTINLEGGGANQIVRKDNVILVTLNSSEEVVAIDADEREVFSRTSIPTEAYAGPRECAPIESGFAYVTAYSGKVYFINYLDGLLLDSADCVGKPESVILNENADIMTICSPYDETGYGFGQTVSVFNGFLGLEETTNDAGFEVSPNPATDRLLISFVDIKSQIVVSIHDLSGQQVYDSDFSGAKEISIDLRGFSSGSYIITIDDGKSRRARLLNIIR